MLIDLNRLFWRIGASIVVIGFCPAQTAEETKNYNMGLFRRYFLAMEGFYGSNFEDCSISTEFQKPFELKPRDFSDPAAFKHYFDVVKANEQVEPFKLDRVGRGTLVPAGLDKYALENRFVNEYKSHEGYWFPGVGQGKDALLYQPGKVFDYGRSKNLTNILATLISIKDQDASQLYNDSTINKERHELLIKRDMWTILSWDCSVGAFGSALTDVLYRKEPLTDEVMKRVRDVDKEKNDRAMIELKSISAKFDFSVNDVPGMVGDALGSETVANEIRNSFMVPIEDSFNFQHFHAFYGSSLFFAYIHVPNWDKVEVGRRFSLVRKIASEKKPLRLKEAFDLPQGSKTFLVRIALLPFEVYSTHKVAVRPIRMVEEVLVREYKKIGEYMNPDDQFSDFYGTDFRQYKLSRERFIRSDRAYMHEVKNDDPVFYGFRTDVPDGANAGKMVTTMRMSCADCHSSEPYGWRTIRSARTIYSNPRYLKLNSTMNVSGGVEKLVIDYINQNEATR
jgi:hypothetical protein